MKITVLGCGSSGGVPLIGNDWGSCDPQNPINRRTRVSVLIEHGDAAILIDTSPDLRQQMLDCNIKRITSILYTHAHADHCHGIDDLRSVNWLMQRPIDLYGNAATMQELSSRFPYIFNGKAAEVNFFKPSLVPHSMSLDPFVVDGLTIIPFEQDHGYSTTLGFRIGDFAYSTDAKRLNETAFKALEGIKLWIVDCVREQEHPTHSHFSQTLEWIERVKPDRAYLTHMNHFMDYETIKAKCPRGVLPAHDGLILEC